MKAIILNSGIGKRLKPFTNENPKCLVKINGDTILEHEIKNLLDYGIKDIIITTGLFEEKIKGAVKSRFPELNVDYVKNDKPESTNYIYSLWLLRDLLDEDVILMHGDMVFEKQLLGRLISSKYSSSVLVNSKIEVPEKDFKARVKDDYINEIGINVFGKDAFFMAPVYKLSKNDFKLWMGEISKFIERNEVTVYAENAFNNISNQIKLHPIYYSNEFCMEIDNPEDLNSARKFFKKKYPN